MTRVRLILALIAVVALAACSDVTGPKPTCQVVGGGHICDPG